MYLKRLKQSLSSYVRSCVFEIAGFCLLLLVTCSFVFSKAIETSEFAVRIKEKANDISLDFLPRCIGYMRNNTKILTERGGSVVTHETRIREVPGSNPGSDQPDCGFFVVFLSQ